MAKDKNNGFNPRVIIPEGREEEIIDLRPTRTRRGEGKRLTPAQKIEMVFMMAKAVDAADERRRCSGSEKND